jgi:hypothetical protein
MRTKQQASKTKHVKAYYQDNILTKNLVFSNLALESSLLDRSVSQDRYISC